MLETGLSHKPYIDGLRAVAVLAVIFFHINPELFPGGYLGVDIFFVISGFVISQALYKDHRLNGNINIIQFYKKRFKRLYPALLVMVAVTTAAYILFGFLWDTNLFIKSSIFSILAVSNLYFLKQGDDYFAQDLINPLLHTWSLGIEEQFYLLYPLLLSFGLWGITKYKLRVRLVAWVIGIASVVLYVFFATGGGGVFSNFYFPTARFWELGAGCALFFFTQNNGSGTNTRLSMLLASGILAFVIIFHPLINNLYLETFLAVIGSVGIIYAGLSGSSSMVLRLLEHPYVVFIGTISYSLYLWHLPVIYFANLYLTGPIFYGTTVFATISFALLSFYFIETPLRYSTSLDKAFRYIPAAGLVVGLLVVVIAASAGVTDIKKAINTSLNDLDSKLTPFNYIETNFSLGQRIQPEYVVNGHSVSESCVANSEQPSDQYYLKEECLKHVDEGRVIFLNGDSHAMHFVPMIDNSKEVLNLYFRELPRSVITDTRLSSEQELAKSSVMRERLAEIQILSKSYSEVYYVMSLFLDQKEYDLTEIEKNLGYFIKLQSPDTHIIFIAPTPVFVAGPESCVILGKFCTLDRAEEINRVRSIVTLYKSLDTKFENVHIYDPYDAVCPESRCLIYDKDRDFLLYRDDDHLSVEGSRSLSSHFDDWFRKEFTAR